MTYTNVPIRHLRNTMTYFTETQPYQRAEGRQAKAFMTSIYFSDGVATILPKIMVTAAIHLPVTVMGDTSP